MLYRLAQVLIFCCVCFPLIITTVHAQVVDDWQVLRIFVPEEELGALVPNDYNPVELEDLTGALAREAARRMKLQTKPHIAEALYVVRCSAENLVSDQSRWTVKSQLPNASLELEGTSVAIRNSGSTPADDRPLIPSLRFSADGGATISKILGDTNFWFGMSARPTSTSGNQSVYDLKLPAATMARMLISTPESIQISSPDVVVTEVPNPRDYLPEKWPSLATSDGQHWFLLHLSGKSQFRLISEVTERKNALAYQNFVRRATLAYTASERGLSVTGDFEVERTSTATSLQIVLAKSLRLRTLSINGVAAEYRMATSADDKTAFDVPLSNVPGGSARVRIEANSSVAFPFDDLVPSLEIAHAFVWEGRTTLVAEDDLVSEQLVLANRIDSAKPRLDLTTIGKRWVTDWIGVQPPLRASIGRSTAKSTADGFTRLTVQKTWIAATTNLQIACKSLVSNELHLEVGDGWFIDDLTVEKSDLPISAQLPDGKAGDVILMWDRLAAEMSINLQVVAHLPRSTDGEQFSLQAPRVVKVNDAVQRDLYAIEQSGRFRIQADPILQRLQPSESDLATWQLPLLSRMSTTQLFQSLGDSVPPIVLNRSNGTYTAKVVTVARPLNGQLLATYTVEIQPTAGAIDLASCVLSLPPSVRQPNWRVTREVDGEQVPIAKATVTSSSDGTGANSRSDMRFEFQLPDTISDRFVLQCELTVPLNESETTTLPVVTMPVAIETWLMLPRSLELPSTNSGVVALPSSMCCDSSELASVMDKEVDTMVGYRYDPGIVSSIELREVARQHDRGAWIWSDTTEHWLYNDGRVAHQMDLSIFAPESTTLFASLPNGWVVNRVTVDGVSSVVGQQLDTQTLPIVVPKGEHVRLSLRASSQNGIPTWFTRVELSKPSFSLTSVDSSDSIWLQPGRVASAEIFQDSPLSIAQRLSPITWWRWLSPSSIDIANTVQSEGWRKVQLRTHLNVVEDDAEEKSSPKRLDASQNAAALLVERASLCTICIAILFAIAGLSFWLLGDRVVLWWLCLTVTTSALLMVPPVYVGGAQLGLLSLVLGAFARLIRVITIAPTNQAGLSRNSSTIVRASATLSAMLFMVSSGSISNAQDTSFGNPTEKTPPIYGVLIPLNTEGDLSAKHVYAPRKLMNLLNSSDAPDVDEQQPQILGAKYILKIGGGTSLTASYVQELTAEFDLLFNSVDFALRLPFKQSQTQLLRGYVSGQSVFIGTRLQQTPDAIIYRPLETGRVRLRLQLSPMNSLNLDRTGIDIAIPRIASSVLEVVADDSLDVNIDSVGLVRRLTASNWSAELGPADSLRVDWPTRPPRAPMPNQASVQSDSWLHVSDSQIVADCQLRITSARALPKQLHLVLDAGWEPVGADWNDAKLITSEPSPAGNRRVYLVDRDSISDRAIIRVLMVPRNAETVSTLAVPFFSLTESAISNRTLALSVAGRSRWKLVGNEFWRRMNATSTDLEWDSSKPTMTDLWGVPSGTMSGSLQRVTNDAAVTVDESSELQLLSTKTLLRYRANWSQPAAEQVLKLELPFDSELLGVNVNGVEAEYQLSERADRKFLLVSVARTSGEVRSVDVQSQISTKIGQDAPLPRIVLKEAAVSHSIYRVECGAELICSLSDGKMTEPEDRLKFAQPNVDSNLMLTSLTAPVGVIDLANSYRESTQLPTTYHVQKRLPATVVASAMAMTRTELGWRANASVLLSSEKPIDFVFFDVPTSIRDLIESSDSPYRVVSSGAAGRSTLCLIPEVLENGLYRAMFDFRLTALGSSQSLTIPEIFFLGESASRPVLALPNKIDDKLVRWSQAGRRLPDDWLSKSGLEFGSADFDCFEMGESQQQATWRPSEAVDNQAEVLFAWAVVDEDSQGNTIGAVNYWIEPNNRLSITLNLPKGSELIGIQAGRSNAVWHSDDEGRIRVLMQPNYMPVPVRVLLRWPSVAVGAKLNEEFGVQLPSIDAKGLKQMPIAVLSSSRLVRVTFEEEQMDAPEVVLRDGLAATQFEAMRVASWRDLLLKSQPVVSNLRENELASWIRNWTPKSIGLNQMLAMPDPVSNGVGDGERDNVLGFWEWYLSQILETKIEQSEAEMQGSDADVLLAIDPVEPSVSKISDMPGLDTNWYLVDVPNGDSVNDLKIAALKLQFARQQRPRANTALAISAALITTASGLLYFLFLRFRHRTAEIVSAHAWLYWAFLAGLAWLLLPVSWPSIVVAVAALYMFAGQLKNTRRRQLAIRR